MKHCHECKWWDNDAEDNELGLCCRYAPRPIEKTVCGQKTYVFWPNTDEDDWCGEFEAKDG